MIRSQLNSYNGSDPVWGFVALLTNERFTGEAAVGLDPRVRLFAVDGRVYLAEREGDAPLGTRLVTAGVITSTQLEAGSVRIGDSVSLARLFQRDPSVDRDAVELTVEHSTEQLLGTIANKPVGMPEVFPLRHHSSGIHQWLRVAAVAPAVEEEQTALVVEEPVIEEPVAEAPAVEAPVVEAPVVEAPVVSSWSPISERIAVVEVEPVADVEMEPIAVVEDPPAEPAWSPTPLTSTFQPLVAARVAEPEPPTAPQTPAAALIQFDQTVIDESVLDDETDELAPTVEETPEPALVEHVARPAMPILPSFAQLVAPEAVPTPEINGSVTEPADDEPAPQDAPHVEAALPPDAQPEPEVSTNRFEPKALPTDLPKLASAPISMAELTKTPEPDPELEPVVEAVLEPLAVEPPPTAPEVSTSPWTNTTHNRAAVDIWEMVDDILTEDDGRDAELVTTGGNEKRSRSWLRGRKG